MSGVSMLHFSKDLSPFIPKLSNTMALTTHTNTHIMIKLHQLAVCSDTYLIMVAASYSWLHSVSLGIGAPPP